MRLLSVFVVLISVISCSPADKGTTTIIPKVQEVEHRASYFNLNNFTLYADENAWAAAELLSLELQKLAYPSDTIVLFNNPESTLSFNLTLFHECLLFNLKSSSSPPICSLKLNDLFSKLF